MSATYQRETFGAIREEISALLALHWDEVALHRDKIKLAVDEEKYAAFEAANALNIVTARWAGRLVGYCVHFLSTHPHYKNDLMAFCDVYFVHPDFRRGTLGTKMFVEVERVLRDRGAKKITMIVKTAHDHSAIFHRLGYADTEKVLTKYVGD